VFEFELAECNKLVCLLFKYNVYPSNNNDNIFINREVLKKLLSGLITNNTIIIIDKAEQVHIFLVPSVNIFKLNDCSVSI
jgi:hypothetical protein